MVLADTATAIAIELFCGAAGALAVRWRYPGFGLGAFVAIIVGMIGGYAFTILAAHVPGIGRFVGQVENAADSTMRETGGLTSTILIGVGISGLLGGAILAFIVAVLRNYKGLGK
jgi:hypothetical protein